MEWSGGTYLNGLSDRTDASVDNQEPERSYVRRLIGRDHEKEGSYTPGLQISMALATDSLVVSMSRCSWASPLPTTMEPQLSP